MSGCFSMGHKREQLPIALTGGAMSFDLRYDLSYGKDGLRLAMRAPALTLANLAVDGKSLFHGTAQLDKFRKGIGQFQLAYADNGITLLRTTIPQATIEGLRIAPSGNAAGQIKLASATLKDATVDNQTRKLSIGSLA